LLRISDINVHYGKLHILKGVSLTIDYREIVTIIGANGTGKTTLIKSISGFLNLSSGAIEFEGGKIDDKQYYERVKLGISQVPEGRQLFPLMTVKENIELGSYLREDDEEISRDKEFVYKLFPRLRERERQFAGTLSGGEQQMLAIARGLMAKPKLLLLDEPSLGLAPLIFMEIFRILKDLNAQGRTILLVEQNANLALQISNRGYVMENGSIVSEGAGKELLNNEHVRKAYLGI
jgi:branched-chain amino acid transport system ATP-binding protein